MVNNYFYILYRNFIIFLHLTTKFHNHTSFFPFFMAKQQKTFSLRLGYLFKILCKNHFYI